MAIKARERFIKKLRDPKSSLSLREQRNVKKSRHKSFSLRNDLRRKRKSNEIFETMIARLTLEELIALKLELTSRSIGKGMFGFPLWRAIDEIVRLAAILFASSVTSNQHEASAILGVSPLTFKGLEYTALRGRKILDDEEMERYKFNKNLR